MANQEHLAILRRGVGFWNDWRENNQMVMPELSTLSPEELALNEAYLMDRNRFQLDQMRADLSRTDLSGMYLAGIDFSEVDLSYSNLRGTNLSFADLNGANLRGANLEIATLIGADLSSINLMSANLSYAKMRLAILIESNLVGADMSFTKLKEANLSRANLVLTVLNLADLRSTLLIEAKLLDTNLRGANLQDADLRGAYLTKVELAGTSLSGAVMGWTSLKNLDMRDVHGLKEIQHFGPSSIGWETLFYSNGVIPKEFMQGCGLSDWQINQVPARGVQMDPKVFSMKIGVNFEQNFVFISHSSRDRDFVDKLYNDLQRNGVRCYYSAEDEKIGSEFRSNIDQKIMACYKMILILSTDSINSQWVTSEVESALEEEIVSNRSVIFPIRVDDAVLNTRTDWAALIRRRRNIGDFSQWRNGAKYRQAFDRLLRDLRT